MAWLRYSTECLVELYSEWGKPDKAVECKVRLKELDQKED